MTKRLYSVIRDDLRRLADLDARDGQAALFDEAADAIDRLLAVFERMFVERRKLQRENADLKLLLAQTKKFVNPHKAP